MWGELNLHLSLTKEKAPLLSKWRAIGDASLMTIATTETLSIQRRLYWLNKWHLCARLGKKRDIRRYLATEMDPSNNNNHNNYYCCSWNMKPNKLLQIVLLLFKQKKRKKYGICKHPTSQKNEGNFQPPQEHCTREKLVYQVMLKTVTGASCESKLTFMTGTTRKIGKLIVKWNTMQVFIIILSLSGSEAWFQLPPLLMLQRIKLSLNFDWEGVASIPSKYYLCLFQGTDAYYVALSFCNSLPLRHPSFSSLAY